MYKTKKTLFLMTETPLHAGSGSDLGIVDLPIQRERHTGFPKIEASSLKGAIRESFEGIDTFELQGKTIQINKKANNKDLYLVFGPEGDDVHAGAIGFSDARLLLFPVKSMKGVFAWVTCPKALEQFQRDMKISGHGNEEIPQFDFQGNECYTNSKHLVFNDKIALEEYTFSVKKLPNNFNIEGKDFGVWLSENIAADTQWTEKLKSDIVVLSNDDFSDFVNLSTEVITRTKIDNETGTVETGALWTEEYLPAETLMYSMAFTSDFFLDNKLEENYKSSKLIEINSDSQSELVMNFFGKGLEILNNFIQIGGNSTLGKGLTHLKLV